MKVRFKVARLGFRAGTVIESSSLKSGLIKTLFDFNVLEEVKEDGDKLDVDAGNKPKQPSSKPKRSKKAPSSE